MTFDRIEIENVIVVLLLLLLPRLILRLLLRLLTMIIMMYKKTDGSVSDKFGVQKFATNRPITKK